MAEDIAFLPATELLARYRRKELSPEDILTNADFVQDGKVTPAGISELKRRMPFVDFAKFESNPQVREFSNLLTVGDLCRYVESKVAAK